jgi:hypothetical protein
MLFPCPLTSLLLGHLDRLQPEPLRLFQQPSQRLDGIDARPGLKA